MKVSILVEIVDLDYLLNSTEVFFFDRLPIRIDWRTAPVTKCRVIFSAWIDTNFFVLITKKPIWLIETRH
ncbi:TPA: hypothetical protein I7730_00700 [Vibrio vulnificus]|uniref:Uncharacterized protein n=1 Tax=Vibrio vulnificus TaxID=672 RepID=A0A8H9MYB1_VIBVL|nr:hypothetical protein [Vibrio vulnificus]